jgi:hypothetical protein
MSHVFAAAASQDNPSRNDSILGRVVNVPGNPLRIPPAAAAFPAAINPNDIQILSGVSHSSSRKKRTVENATAAPPTVAPRNPHDVLDLFIATQERERIHSDTATLTSSLVALSGLPDSDNKRIFQDFAFQALTANIQKLNSCLPPLVPPPPPVPPPPVVPELMCSICRDTIQFLAARNTYIQATFTSCGHGFHSNCLQMHRDNGEYGSYDKCPDCRALL